MLFLGIEKGHEGTRVIVIDLKSSTICSEAWVAHDWIEGLPAGHHTQNSAQWIDTVDCAIRESLSGLDEQKDRVEAISVAGPQRGLVLLDASDCIICPTRLAGNNFTKRQEEEIARAFGGAPRLIELIGQAPRVDSAAAELLWLKQHEPYHFQKAASILTVQDFISYWLTGERATDASSASSTGLFDIRNRTWSVDLMDFIEPEISTRLPKIIPSNQSRGLLRPALARKWGLSNHVLIASGGPAPMLTTLAAGCLMNGSVAVELGTTSVITGIANSPVIDYRAEILSLCNASGSWMGMGTVTNAGVTPEILCRQYDWSPATFEQMAASITPGADGLLLLPYFTGESKPRLPEGTGVIHGITPKNFTPAHLARATIEGVALGLGYAMNRLRDLEFDPSEIRLLGSSASSPVTRQIMADVFGVPVVTITSSQGPAFGAAMQAAFCFLYEDGESINFKEIVNHLVRIDTESYCEPDPQKHQIYQELISRQQYLVETFHPAGFL